MLTAWHCWTFRSTSVNSSTLSARPAQSREPVLRSRRVAFRFERDHFPHQFMETLVGGFHLVDLPDAAVVFQAAAVEPLAERTLRGRTGLLDRHGGRAVQHLPQAPQPLLVRQPGLGEIEQVGFRGGDGGSRARGVLGVRARFQLPVQIDQRQQSPAQAVHGRAVNHLDSLPLRSGLYANQLQQVDLRDGIALARAGNNQRGNNGQGERNLHAHHHPLSRPGLQVDGAADFFDVGLDHVHAHPAAGDVGHFLRRGEARQENQIHDLVIRQAASLLGRDQALLYRLVADPRLIETGPVVRNLDVDLSSFMKRAQEQPALRIFPGGLPDLGVFDAMIHGIPHQVGQRILDGLDQRLVQFGLLALHLHPHLLAAVQGEVAHGTRKLAPDVADRLHSGLHHPFLQLGRDQVEPLAGGQEAASSVLLANCKIWLRASTSSPTRFINWSSRLTSSRMVRSLALCPRAPCCRCSASTTSAGRATPCSTRISPMWRGSPSFCFSAATRISAGVTPARCIRMSPIDDGKIEDGKIETVRRPFRKNSPAPEQPRSSLGSPPASAPAFGSLLQPGQPRNQPTVVAFALAARGFYARQHLADRVHHGQQSARDFSTQLKLAIAQPPQQAFADMRHGSQLVERQKTRRAFNGVNRAENAGQNLAVVGILLQRNQIPVQTVEVLRALHQKLFDDVVRIIHSEYPLHRRGADLA